MISEEKNRDFLIIDQMGIGEKGGVFDFTDELEVNGNVKVKDLRVEGNVTFAGNKRLVMHLSIRLHVNQTQHLVVSIQTSPSNMTILQILLSLVT